MRKRKIPAQPPRQAVPVEQADPAVGLTKEQAELRSESGWANSAAVSAGKTEKEIVLENCLTFFNFVFIVLAVIVLLGGSSIKNMTLFIDICYSFCLIKKFGLKNPFKKARMNFSTKVKALAQASRRKGLGGSKGGAGGTLKKVPPSPPLRNSGLNTTLKTSA